MLAAAEQHPILEEGVKVVFLHSIEVLLHS